MARFHITYNPSAVKDLNLDILVQLIFVAVSGSLLFFLQ